MNTGKRSPLTFEDDLVVRCFVAFLSNSNVSVPFEEIAGLADEATDEILRHLDSYTNAEDDEED